MLHDLGWQSLDSRRQDQRLVLIYKIINGLASVETEGILTPADSRTRKNHSFKFKHSYRFSFFPATISSWNNLPFGIEKVDSVEGFKLSVTQMLEELTWVPLSKRRENACLILFYKIINNLAMVPHSCLEKADGRTRKKHNLKFRHIGYNVDPYGQSFFPKCISAWNGLAQEIAEANTLDLFKSKLAH